MFSILFWLKFLLVLMAGLTSYKILQGIFDFIIKEEKLSLLFSLIITFVVTFYIFQWIWVLTISVILIFIALIVLFGFSGLFGVFSFIRGVSK